MASRRLQGFGEDRGGQGRERPLPAGASHRQGALRGGEKAAARDGDELSVVMAGLVRWIWKLPRCIFTVQQITECKPVDKSVQPVMCGV